MIGQDISHHRILEKLGQGGMGVVYKAEDLKLKRLVALKFLPTELTRNEDAKERFIHEAQAASALDHPNLCTIHEFDETEDEQLFIVMAYYNGETLQKKVDSGQLMEGFKPEAMVLLEAYNWPGNVRELENVVERMVILAEQDSGYLGPELLLPEIQGQASMANEAAPKPSPPDLKSQHDAHERAMLIEALSKHRWNQTAAAKALGMRESNLRYKMRKFGIHRP